MYKSFFKGFGIKNTGMAGSNPTIDSMLDRYSSLIGRDYGRYKNHVYRVFLNCLLLDGKPGNEEKYAIAAAFHDIGIWTDNTLDYLQPSIARAKEYLKEAGRTEWIEEISLMIDMHHKWSKYQGKCEETVEAFRKADWIDVSLGLITFGVDRQATEANRKKYPNSGFHQFLIAATAKALLNNPLRNPLPMFKK